VYYLDTNTCFYFLNGRYESIRDKLLATPPKEILIPSLVKAELLFGAFKSVRQVENVEKVERFLAPFGIISFDGAMARTYAEIRHETERCGTIIGPNNSIIAAIVKHQNGTFVTHNVKVFEQIKGLVIENWVHTA